MRPTENNPNDKSNHAPGTGSDKQHPETPSDANERFQKEKKNIQEHPDNQHTG